MTRIEARNDARPSGLVKRSRNNKALFLPMKRAAADELVLPVRISFERIRQGKADRDATVCMAEILLLTGFLTESGFGRLDSIFLSDVEKRLLTELNRDSSGEWQLAARLVDDLGIVVNEYDRLVREARLQAIVEANESFSRLKPTQRTTLGT
ncbi:Fis family transcriptional regulator [Caballeronia calidae]|uniref:Fis family transcriptional regulator n=1 Tax=Caballeronia calidae TaxID=1777139 RepID=A0A158EEJ7_9BURK|nr:Fis family transcriptional regulator [Caballeronia calidae]SAL05193.1 Fis family transcriptional regulator [Caballeronia calidae]